MKFVIAVSTIALVASVAVAKPLSQDAALKVMELYGVALNRGR